MAVSLGLSPPETAKRCGFLRSYQRVIGRAIALAPILGCGVFLVAQFPNELGLDFLLTALLLIFVASQIFWIGRILDLGERFIPGKSRRAWLAIIAGLLYLFVFTYSFPEWWGGHRIRAADYRMQSVLIDAAFWWWFVGSLLAFLLVIAFGVADRTVRAATWVQRRARKAAQAHLATADPAAAPSSRGRRRLLEQTAVLVSATPFVAAGYGLLYGRLDVEVVRQRIRLARLPKAFEGFRIAQLSDIHISPFSSADYIRHCVAITNGLKPDLVALTGDYIAWDPEAQDEVVRLLAKLGAPHGVFGCLGNHEISCEVEASITGLFAAQGIRILRQERAPIRLRGETLNLIGIDCPRGGSDEEWRANLNHRLQQIKGLMMPDTVNILLSHYTYVFDRVAGLGIDLTLAGDLHGGAQLSLDFVHRGLNLGHLVGVRYVSGWYEQHGAQLYVNRGIGTTGFPIRLGARPEITILELVRA